MAELVPDEARTDDIVALLRRCADDLRALAASRPAFLVVDDAQLLDPVSAALVLHLATSSSAFILATVRVGEPCPDAVVSLWKDDTAPRLELHALSDEEVRALVETVLGDPVEEAALDWIAEVSRGNALYARELVRDAVEGGVLVRSPGFWRLEGRITAGPSLVDLIVRRMDGLAADHRRAVELLALGEPLALEEIGGLTSEETLIEAEAHGLIATGVTEVRLAHPLYGEAVRATLPPLRARSVHFQQHDPFNVMLTVRAFQAGTASVMGDFDGTMAALERLHAWSESHGPMPAQRVPVRRAEGWALRIRNAADAGRQLLEDAASLEEMVGLAPQLAYDALRVGAPASWRSPRRWRRSARSAMRSRPPATRRPHTSRPGVRTPLDGRRRVPANCTSPIRAPSFP